MSAVLMFAVPFGMGFATRLFVGGGKRLVLAMAGVLAAMALLIVLLAGPGALVGAGLLIFPVFLIMYVCGVAMAAEWTRRPRP
jgi:hypothetical protein